MTPCVPVHALPLANGSCRYRFRVVYDFLFFVMMILIVLNLILGVIIDTFVSEPSLVGTMHRPELSFGSNHRCFGTEHWAFNAMCIRAILMSGCHGCTSTRTWYMCVRMCVDVSICLFMCVYVDEA